jgi:hypothetical protein
MSEAGLQPNMGGTTDVTAFVPIGMNAVLFNTHPEEYTWFPSHSIRLEEFTTLN